MVHPQVAMGTHVTSSARRKVLGQWFTPPALVEHLVDVAIPGDEFDRAGTIRSVLDPACGDGRFLTAVRDLVGGGSDVSLMGVDIDHATAVAARRAVPGARIVRADALAHSWGHRRFDLVIGNPPFLNQMATATTRGGPSRFGGGAYAGSAAEFLALAMQLAKPDGGRVALVLPQSLLTARDVGPIRDQVRGRAALRHIWWSPTLMFDASVRTCALVFELGAAQGLVTRTHGKHFELRQPVDLGRSWARLLLERPMLDASAPAPEGTPTLGDLATFTVDFRDQYYALVDAVGEDADGIDGPPLITSGLIDPGVCHWGTRPVRFAKRTFSAPRADLSKLSPRLQRWAANRLVPKVLIANQTRCIEAVADPTGQWLPGVPVITCIARNPDDFERVLAVLSAPHATRWVLEHAAGSGLSANAVRLTPALLGSIPLEP